MDVVRYRNRPAPFPAWSPLTLFANGEQGALFVPEPHYLFQDAAGTTPVTVDGDPVGRMLDLSPNGHHATQPVSGSRPTYRTVGTYRWLEFDGVDDWLSTDAIDFTGSDKLGVFAALHKASDSGTALLCETSPNSQSNPGAFHIAAPALSGARSYRFAVGRLDGGWSDASTAPSWIAPVTSVATGLADASQPIVRIRVDGEEVADSGIDNAAGVGSYALNIGARAGGGLAFTGRLYGLAIRAALTNDPLLSQVESYMARLAGVTLND